MLRRSSRDPSEDLTILHKETDAMTAPSSVDSARFLHISWPASPDLLPQMPTTFINGLTSAEADMI
jgi:hypothetical protein